MLDKNLYLRKFSADNPAQTRVKPGRPSKKPVFGAITKGMIASALRFFMPRTNSNMVYSKKPVIANKKNDKAQDKKAKIIKSGLNPQHILREESKEVKQPQAPLPSSPVRLAHVALSSRQPLAHSSTMASVQSAAPEIAVLASLKSLQSPDTPPTILEESKSEPEKNAEQKMQSDGSSDDNDTSYNAASECRRDDHDMAIGGSSFGCGFHRD